MTDQEHPAPMTPQNCDLRDFPRMMIDIPRLRASAFDATFDDAAWRAGINLWFSSWHSVPAASLDADEPSLCKAAGLSRDLRTWRKVSVAAMRGWVLCSDDRYYHETVAEFALEAWIEKLLQRRSSGAGNAARWGTDFDPSTIEAEVTIAVDLLTAIAPDSKAIPKASRRMSVRNPTGKENSSHRDNKTIPPGSQETLKRQRREENKPSVPSGVCAEPEVGSTPDVPQLDLIPKTEPPKVFIRIPTNRFETTGEEVDVTDADIADWETAFPAVDVRQQLRTMRQWSIAKKRKRKTVKGMRSFITGWLADKQDKGSINGNSTHHNGSAAQTPRSSFATAISDAVDERSAGGLFDKDGKEAGRDAGGPITRIDREMAIDVEPIAVP